MWTFWKILLIKKSKINNRQLKFNETLTKKNLCHLESLINHLHKSKQLLFLLSHKKLKNK